MFWYTAILYYVTSNSYTVYKTDSQEAESKC